MPPIFYIIQYFHILSITQNIEKNIDVLNQSKCEFFSYSSHFIIFDFAFQKSDMLKGLKKVKPIDQEEQINTVRLTVNENSIKNQAMDDMDQQQIINTHMVEESTIDHFRKAQEECLELYLSGQTEGVLKKLEELQRLRAEKPQQKEMSISKPKGKFDYQLDFQEEVVDEKKKSRKRDRPIMKSNRVQQYCIHCPDNEELRLLSASNYVYLALPKVKTFRNYPHFILAPVDHQQTSVGLNEDILTELENYKKCLIQAFDKLNMQMVFFQQFSKDNSHIYIECVAMSMNKAQDLPFFFKQSLEDVEGNWNTHKSIIKIEKEKGGLQRQIPKQIKYFYIDFSIGYGYAHVIQNERFWKRGFCYEVIATAMGMQSHHVKTTEEYNEEELNSKQETFAKIWKPFDWTALI